MSENSLRAPDPSVRIGELLDAAARVEAALAAALDLYQRTGAPVEHVTVARALRDGRAGAAALSLTAEALADAWRDGWRSRDAAGRVPPQCRRETDPARLRLVISRASRGTGAVRR